MKKLTTGAFKSHSLSDLMKKKATPFLAINNGTTDEEKMVEETRKEDPVVTNKKKNLVLRLIQ